MQPMYINIDTVLDRKKFDDTVAKFKGFQLLIMILMASEL